MSTEMREWWDDLNEEDRVQWKANIANPHTDFAHRTLAREHHEDGECPWVTVQSASEWCGTPGTFAKNLGPTEAFGHFLASV